MPNPCLSLGGSGTLESHCPGWGKSRGLYPVVFAPKFHFLTFRSLPILQRTQLVTGVRGRQQEWSRPCAPRCPSHPPRGWHRCPSYPGLRPTHSGSRGSSWLRARIVPPGASDRLGCSSASAFELRAAGGNGKKKKKSPKNKTLPKRGGFKRLRKPPTVKHWGSVKQSPSLHLFIPPATRHNPGAVPTCPPVPNRRHGQQHHGTDL